MGACLSTRVNDILLCAPPPDAGNNRADDVREISLLKDVPRLIILELWGNPLTRNQEYRLFTVWHLHRLKVLYFFCHGGLQWSGDFPFVM